MFKKLFSYQPQKQVEVEVAVMEKPSKSYYPKEIQMIHSAFNNEAVKLMEQAQNIINNTTLPEHIVNKADLAEKFGFTSVQEVTKTKHLESIQRKNQRILEAVMESIEFLPQNKWIPEDSVKRICQQWGLVFGPVHRYEGFLPAKNLKEIEDFDKDHRSKFDLFFKIERYTFTDDRFNEISESEFKGYEEININRIKEKETTSLQTLFSYPNMYEPIDIHKGNGMDKLNICAPLKHMDTTGMEVSEGYKLETNIPDPIVLIEKTFKNIKGHYIITAWGDEANDEEVKGYRND